MGGDDEVGDEAMLEPAEVPRVAFMRSLMLLIMRKSREIMAGRTMRRGPAGCRPSGRCQS